MSHDSLPDVIVGIDFGQTCTGVAYTLTAQDASKVQVIELWPGQDETTKSKVPTVLYYKRLQDTAPSSWGFLAEIDGQQHPEGYIAEWFKRLLDSRVFSSRREDGYPLTDLNYADVKNWHVGYLHELYIFIQEIIHMANPHLKWNSASIEFHFSVPTTWEPVVVQTFHDLAHEAGFGKCDNHSHTTFITEPEAVAIHVLKENRHIFKPDEVILICDIGGGTADLAAFRIDSQSLERLKQLEPPQGDDIGSVLIDSAFERVLLERLSAADRQKPLFIEPSQTDLARCAWTMARSQQFQKAKREFVGDMSARSLFIPITGVSTQYRMENPRITEGTMCLDDANVVFTNLFDPVVDRLLGQIDKQFKALENETKVSHLILSGGLGQSPYVKKRVQKHCIDATHTFQNVREIKIHVANEAQLAVCKGIVTNRLVDIHRQRSMMSQKCCQASYGIMAAVPYDPTVHVKPIPPPVRDRQDQKLYLPRSVDWLILKVNPETPSSDGFLLTSIRRASQYPQMSQS